MISCRVENTTQFHVSLRFICGIIKEVAHFSKKYKRGSVFIYIVGPARSRALNKRLRGKDEATDVLSFENSPFLNEPEKWLGEIIFCPSVIEKQAKKRGVLPKEEFAHVAVHGALHVFGYHHETSEKKAVQMRRYEDVILERLGYPPAHTKIVS